MSNPKKNSKRIILYSCEIFDKTRKGALSHTIHYDDEEDFIKQKNMLKEKQAMANVEYRDKHPLPTSRNRPGRIMTPVKNGEHSFNQVNYIDTSIFGDTVNHLPDLKIRNPLIGDGPFKSGVGTSICIMASSTMGKTHVLKAIYDKYYKPADKKRKLISMLFATNIHADVYDDLPDNKVFKCNKFNKDCERLINQLHKVNGMSKNRFNYLVMLDDIIQAKYSRVLNNLILSYRNANFNSICLIQYPMLLSKSSRGNINEVICGQYNNDECCECMIKSFLGSKFNSMGYTTMPAQIALYKKLTADYHFLHYSPRSNTLTRFKLVV